MFRVCFHDKVLRYSEVSFRTGENIVYNKREVEFFPNEKERKTKTLQSIIIVRARNKRHSDIFFFFPTAQSCIIYLESLYQIADTEAEQSSHFTSRSLPVFYDKCSQSALHFTQSAHKLQASWSHNSPRPTLTIASTTPQILIQSPKTSS